MRIVEVQADAATGIFVQFWYNLYSTAATETRRQPAKMYCKPLLALRQSRAVSPTRQVPGRGQEGTAATGCLYERASDAGRNSDVHSVASAASAASAAGSLNCLKTLGTTDHRPPPHHHVVGVTIMARRKKGRKEGGRGAKT